MSFLMIALTIGCLTAIALGLYAVIHSRQRDRHMDAHMRALDVLTDPDLLDLPNDESPCARRRNLRLLPCTAATPGGADWVREKARAHPVSAASFVAVAAAASYLALIWPDHTPDPPMALELPTSPTIASTPTGREPSPSTGPQTPAAFVSGEPGMSDAPPASPSVSLTAYVTRTPGHFPTPSSGPALSSARPSSARPSAPTTTRQTSPRPVCALDLQADLINPCVITR